MMRRRDDVCGSPLARHAPRRALVLSILLIVHFLVPVSVAESQDKHETERPKVKAEIAVTIVYDNNPFDERLEPAWGFACVVQGFSKTILFDTGGDGRVLLSNMAKCHFTPEQIDVVVLSHIHGDHTGGLRAFLNVNPNVTVLVPKAFPPAFKDELRKSAAAVVETEGPARICEAIWTTGVLKDGPEEQGVYLTTPQGLIVITGCAHPGIVRMAQAARQHAGTPVHAVVGGSHMSAASRRRITEVIGGLKKVGVSRVAPCHCSGNQTRGLMEDAFPDGYLPSGVGARIVFPGEAGQ